MRPQDMPRPFAPDHSENPAMTDHAPMSDERLFAILDSVIQREGHIVACDVLDARDYLKDRLRAGGEAVAWIYEERYGHNDDAWIERINRTLPVWETRNAVPLYAAPPRAPVAEGVERAAEVPAVDERGWLLERGPASNPQYATVTNGGIDWTAPSDHAHALRFARRADAEMLATIVEDGDRIAEHGWHGATAAKVPSDSESDLYDRVFSAVTKATPTFVDPMDNSLVRRLGLSEREAMARAVLSALSRPAAEVKP